MSPCPLLQFLRNVPQPVCGDCLEALLDHREPRFTLRLDELRTQRQVEIAVGFCANCGETAPTYRLVARSGKSS